MLVAGASGGVGSAAIRHFARCGIRVRGLSRRVPRLDLEPAEAARVELLRVDLQQASEVASAVSGMRDVTHLVYAALHELPSLVAGWFDATQIATNQAMLENLFEPLLRAAPGLEHVTLLQGTKAYGAHFGALQIPARERDPRVEHENFYWKQEDYLRRKRVGAGWSLSILRPQIVFGDALGVAMNPIPAIGVYAALKRQSGEPLDFPGGPPVVLEAVDADLLARVIAWSGESPAARDETFNVTNGDVFVWRNVWPTISRALGMEPGRHHPESLAQTLPERSSEWDAVVRRYDLLAPGMQAFVGQGFQYADFVMATGAPEGAPSALVSTVKLRAAGFHEVLDTEDMFEKWLHRLQAARLLPPPEG